MSYEKTQNLSEELSWIWDKERTCVNLEMEATLSKCVLHPTYFLERLNKLWIQDIYVF
jgi:hypothetical protein